MKHYKSVIVAVFAVVLGLAYAMPAATASAVSSAALSIVPKKNYTIEPGKSIKDRLTIRNLDNKEPLVLSLRVVDFTYTDDGGSPKLMLDENAPQTTWSLKPFMTIPKSVTVGPGQSETLDMSVAIPAGHGAGSYYSAIVYSSGSSEGGNVGLSASGVTLVFTSIPGDVKEDLKLEKFGAYQEATAGKPAGYKFFTMNQPQMIAYTLKNNGNVTEAPVGSITIKNMFGKETVIKNVNPNQSLALIGQTRTFVSCIKLKSQEVDFNGTRSEATTCASPKLWPGYYSATLNLYYGQNGNQTQELMGRSGFVYLPWWFVIALIVIVLALTIVIWRAVHKRRQKQYRIQKKMSRRK